MPLINAWPGILSLNQREDFTTVNRLPREFHPSAAQIRQGYFFNPVLFKYPGYNFNLEIEANQAAGQIREEKTTAKNLFFLWSKTSSFPRQDKTISYRALISPQGKALLLYPEILLLDPHLNLAYKNYLENSLYSFEKKYFWTKFNILIE